MNDKEKIEMLKKIALEILKNSLITNTNYQGDCTCQICNDIRKKFHNYEKQIEKL